MYIDGWPLPGPLKYIYEEDDEDEEDPYFTNLGSTSDSLALLWHYRPPHLRLTTCNLRSITNIYRLSSIITINISREILETRL